MSTQESTQQPSYHVTAQQPPLPSVSFLKPPEASASASAVSGGDTGILESAHGISDNELQWTQQQLEKNEPKEDHAPALSGIPELPEKLLGSSDESIGHFNVDDRDEAHVSSREGPSQTTWRTRSSPARPNAVSMSNIRRSDDVDELDSSMDFEVPHPDALLRETPPHVPSPPPSADDEPDIQAGPSTPPRRVPGQTISSIRHSKSDFKSKSASRNVQTINQLSPSKTALEQVGKRARTIPPRRLFGRSSSGPSKQPSMPEEESFAGPPMSTRSAAPFERFDRFLKNSTSIVEEGQVFHTRGDVETGESGESGEMTDDAGVGLSIDQTADESLLFADGFRQEAPKEEVTGPSTEMDEDPPKETVKSLPRASAPSEQAPAPAHSPQRGLDGTGDSFHVHDPHESPDIAQPNMYKARFAGLVSSSEPSNSQRPSELFSPPSHAFSSQNSHHSVLFPATQAVPHQRSPVKRLALLQPVDPNEATISPEGAKFTAGSSTSGNATSTITSVPKHRMLTRVNPRSDEESGYLTNTNRSARSRATSRSAGTSARQDRLNGHSAPRFSPPVEQTYQDTQIDKTQVDHAGDEDSPPEQVAMSSPAQAATAQIEIPRSGMPAQPPETLRVAAQLTSSPPQTPGRPMEPPRISSPVSPQLQPVSRNSGQEEPTFEPRQPPHTTPIKYGKGKRKAAFTPASHHSHSEESSPAPEDPEDNTYRPPVKKLKPPSRGARGSKRGRSSKQSSRTSGTPAMPHGPTSPLTPPPSSTTPRIPADEYVLALWADQKYWVGRITGHENGLLHIKFCDGHEKFVPPDKVRNFDLRPGDLIKSVGVHMPLGEVEVEWVWDGANEGIKVRKDGNSVGRVPLDCILIRQKIIVTRFDDRRIDLARFGLKAPPLLTRLSKSNRYLEGKSFMITSISSKNSTDQLRDIITSHGGILINDWQELFILPDDHFGSTFKSSRAPFLIVRGAQEAMKPKMMVALSRGIPCLAEHYLLDLDKGFEVKWQNYLISPGRSEILGQHTSQVIDLEWGGPEWTHTNSANIRQPFKEKKFLFIEPKSKDERFKQVKTLVPFCLHALGAASIETCLMLDRNAKLDVYDYIIIEDRDKSQKVGKEVAASGRMCNFLWLKQCLIMGAALEPAVFAEKESSRGRSGLVK
ncbi:hypothetical protein BCR39DRAFT_553543 [Naematelia encephala]|uniref:BRCT domain-containing protein n=1 Tax=Naematelia encephala TaxID=71784 RepID=A0A1Y2AG85_9TREE|nr:hypothetical protein BCR39DRAFT_553543 [Naematelia encephala]